MRALDSGDEAVGENEAAWPFSIDVGDQLGEASDRTHVSSSLRAMLALSVDDSSYCIRSSPMTKWAKLRALQHPKEGEARHKRDAQDMMPLWVR